MLMSAFYICATSKAGPKKVWVLCKSHTDFLLEIASGIKGGRELSTTLKHIRVTRRLLPLASVVDESFFSVCFAHFARV